MLCAWMAWALIAHSKFCNKQKFGLEIREWHLARKLILKTCPAVAYISARVFRETLIILPAEPHGMHGSMQHQIQTQLPNRRVNCCIFATFTTAFASALNCFESCSLPSSPLIVHLILYLPYLSCIPLAKDTPPPTCVPPPIAPPSCLQVRTTLSTFQQVSWIDVDV